MGMAASQVRFLTLQDRKSTIGMRLGILSNRKMALMRDQNKAAKAYNDAYSEKKLQWYDSINGKYTDITYEAMMTPNAGNSYTPYLITDRNTGKVILDGATNVEDRLGYNGAAAYSDYWNNTSIQPYSPFPQVTGSVQTAGTMPYHMERLVGMKGDNYLPGSVTYDQTKMAPYIIEQIMGVPGFDRDKMIYQGVENKNITTGGYQKLVHSDVMSLMNKEVGTDVSDRSSVHLPVWEVSETKRLDGNNGTMHMGMNILTGEASYMFLQYDETTINKGYNSALAGFTTPEMMSYINDSACSSKAYIDSSGNVHNFTGNEYWSTLYNNGAVIISYSSEGPSVTADNDSTAADSSKLRSINYDYATQWSCTSDNIKKIAKDFVSDVNNSGLLKYKMSDAMVENIAQVTRIHMTDSFGVTNGNSYYGWDDTHKSNVDSNLYIRITKLPDDLDEKDGNGGVKWEGDKGLEKNADKVEYTVTSEQEGDPVGYGTANGTNSLTVAIAKQANAIASPIRINAANWATNSHGDLVNRNPNDPGADSVLAFSLKNLMDIAMYYISIAQEKIAQGDESSVTQAALYSVGKSKNGFSDYQTGNNRNYTEPSNYSQGELAVFQQGETRVASNYAIKSNFDMLQEKVNHMKSMTETSAEDVDWDLFEKIYTRTGDAGYNMQGKLRAILTGEHTVTDSELIALANMNAWVCEALEQDYSTPGGVEEFNNLLKKIKETCDLYRGENCHQNNWDYSQSHYGDSFYYDSGTTWEKRTQLFTQDSEDRVATSKLDIEGQLSALQLHQFHFYENLVKECLARGWKSNDTVADSESTSLHLQNGTWLINDNMAKSSSRVFEVTDKEAREEALSKYEALQSELKIKEERIDVQMDKLETEQNAIKTELDSLKSIIKDNIDSTFKIFNA